MDSKTIDQHLVKLEELVYDEDKIVTCILLADLFKISIQDSKHLLTEFVERQRQKKPHDLSITYLVSGIVEGGSLPTVSLVKEDDLKVEKTKLGKVSCELLYSVQKANDVDFNIIAQTEKSHPDNPRTEALIGSVVGKNCIKRKIRTRTLPVPPPDHKPVGKTKTSFFAKPELDSAANTQVKTEKTEGSKTNGDSNTKSKQEIKGKGKGGITNFFTKGAPKPIQNESKAIKDTDTKRESTSLNIKIEDKLNSNEQDNLVSNEAEEKMEVDRSDKEDEVKKPTVKKTETNTSAKKNKKKRPNKENNDHPSKKRKRIIQRNDSDSDDMFGEDEDNYEDVIEKSFDEEPEPQPIQKAPLAPKNKRRKAVDRTYEDEEGYIVTRTEYIYETPSEDEAEEAAKPPQKPPPKTPASEEKKKANSLVDDTSPMNGKGSKGKKGKKAPAANQPSIMNFFKKK